MAHATLIKPTLHVEVLLNSKVSADVSRVIADDIHKCFTDNWQTVEMNQKIHDYGNFRLNKKKRQPSTDSLPARLEVLFSH